MSFSQRFSERLQSAWWQPHPGVLSRCLWPLSTLYELLASLNRLIWRSGLRRSVRLPVPVWVVGNLIAGGAGKTPTTIALVQWLKSQGWQAGVVSRGYGRASNELHLVKRQSTPAQVGDEPLLIHLRTGAPVAVASNRAHAAQSLLEAYPEVNLIVSDDGLQHWRLQRDHALLVFDARGVGNGCLLPAGPLRERLPSRCPPNTWVLYNANAPSTALPGACAQRRLAGAIALADWWHGQGATQNCLEELIARSKFRPVLAVAGIAEPGRFFEMLIELGLAHTPLPLEDHAPLFPLPWPPDTVEVVLTEKDAVKLRPEQLGLTRVWVVPLDFQLPAALAESMRLALTASQRLETDKK